MVMLLLIHDVTKRFIVRFPVPVAAITVLMEATILGLPWSFRYVCDLSEVRCARGQGKVMKFYFLAKYFMLFENWNHYPCYRVRIGKRLIFSIF